MESASVEAFGIGSFDELERSDAAASAVLAEGAPGASDALPDAIEEVLEPLSAASHAVPVSCS